MLLSHIAHQDLGLFVSSPPGSVFSSLRGWYNMKNRTSAL
uniref:Uncharacterized protein n=1 Tax=Arundo donax TaxID=35708 RepID=A0A0A9FHS5_ARUDO